MDLKRKKQIDEIFHAALHRDPSARVAFLADACKGDEAMRKEIDILLAQHEKDISQPDRPAAGLAAGLFATRDTHYQILKRIGSGGMGEVYLAEDTRLNRKVALKLLPPEFTRDKERIRRFEREARAASALNHPNILTIYDIGQIDSSNFIASEYIEGETLRTRMRSGKMSLKEILTICIQVAEALNAAHRAGIIHRDIKPENIMVRRDGYVKVLDFGLAKLAQPQTTHDVSDIETRSSPDTRSGIVVGTTRYMSPEQARGAKVDERSDLFSLGVVLYEMIASRPPFEGVTSSDILAAILERNPAPLRTYGDFPEELQWIVTKTLAKDAEERYQTAIELLADLKRIRKQLEIHDELKVTDSRVPSHRIDSGTDKLGPSLNPKRIAIASAVLILLALLAVLFTRRFDEKLPASRKAFSKIKLTRLTSSGTAYGATISPDGKYVAYFQLNAQDQEVLYLKQLTADTEIQILTLPPGTYSYGGIRFSNDGEYIYYLSGSETNIGSLYKMPVIGGIAHKVVEDINYVPAISPDGKLLAFRRDTDSECWLMISGADGSNQRKIGSRKIRDCYSDLEWSPDGRIIASFLDSITPQGLSRQIIGIDPNDGSEFPLSPEKWSAERSDDLQWLGDGSGLILTKQEEGKAQIYFASYPEGKLSPITNDPNEYIGVSSTMNSEALVTTQMFRESTIWIAPSTQPDAVVQITTGSHISDGAVGLSWTHDERLLYSSMEPSGILQLWLMNSDGTEKKRITTGDTDKYWPVASLDGRYIVYSSEPGKIWRRDWNSDNRKQLSGTKPSRFPRFSPDGKWVIYSTYGSEKHDLVKVSIDGNQQIILASHPNIYGGAVSPDGRKIAYAYYDKPYSEITMNIISSNGGSPLRSIRLDGSPHLWGRIHWRPDGKGIAYISYKDDESNIYIQSVDNSTEHRLTNFTSKWIVNFSWSPDGKRIAYSFRKETNDIVLIQNLP